MSWEPFKIFLRVHQNIECYMKGLWLIILRTHRYYPWDFEVSKGDTLHVWYSSTLRTIRGRKMRAFLVTGPLDMTCLPYIYFPAKIKIFILCMSLHVCTLYLIELFTTPHSGSSCTWFIVIEQQWQQPILAATCWLF